MCQPPMLNLATPEADGAASSLNLLRDGESTFNAAAMGQRLSSAMSMPPYCMQETGQVDLQMLPKLSRQCEQNVAEDTFIALREGQASLSAFKDQLQPSSTSSPGGGMDPLDLNLQELETKLNLITLQRSVSALKCQMFLEYLESLDEPTRKHCVSPSSSNAASTTASPVSSPHRRRLHREHCQFKAVSGQNCNQIADIGLPHDISSFAVSSPNHSPKARSFSGPVSTTVIACAQAEQHCQSKQSPSLQLCHDLVYVNTMTETKKPKTRSRLGRKQSCQKKENSLAAPHPAAQNCIPFSY